MGTFHGPKEGQTELLKISLPSFLLDNSISHRSFGSSSNLATSVIDREYNIIYISISGLVCTSHKIKRKTKKNILIVFYFT